LRESFFHYLLLPALVGLLIGLSNYLLLTLVEALFSAVKELLLFKPSFPLTEPTEVYRLFGRIYLFPLLLFLGGLAVGLLKFFFLGRESTLEGTGNFVIKNFHRGRPFSLKKEAVRAFSSVLTVGLGGTAGLLAPAASVGATLSDAVSRAFSLKPQERRALVAGGFGAGVSSMFGAPLAGALIAAEAFYKFDFEVGVLVPASVASVVAYVVSSELTGYGFLFEPVVEEFQLSAESLLLFFLFGLLSGLFVRLYTALYGGLSSFFKNLFIPLPLVPALGALLSASLVTVNPLSLGKGDLWLEPLMEGQISEPLLLFLTPFTVALASSLLLTSGNGGGIFAPSITAGAFLGGAYAHLSGLDLPSMVVIGMMTTFGAGAKMPISTLIVVAEMTGGYELLIPAVASLSGALLTSGKSSFFSAQVERRFQSPAHGEEFELYALKAIKVKDFMVKPVVVVSPQEPLGKVLEKLNSYQVSGFPVVEEGKLVGIVTKEDLIRRLEDLGELKVSQVMTESPAVIGEEATLFDALRLMMEKDVGRLPVVGKEGKLVGIITVKDVGEAVKRFLEGAS